MKTTLRHFIFASIGSVLLILAGCMDDQKKPEEKKKEEPQTNVEKKEEPPKTEDKQKEETPKEGEKGKDTPKTDENDKTPEVKDPTQNQYFINWEKETLEGLKVDPSSYLNFAGEEDHKYLGFTLDTDHEGLLEKKFLLKGILDMRKVSTDPQYKCLVKKLSLSSNSINLHPSRIEVGGHTVEVGTIYQEAVINRVETTFQPIKDMDKPFFISDEFTKGLYSSALGTAVQGYGSYVIDGYHQGFMSQFYSCLVPKAMQEDSNPKVKQAFENLIGKLDQMGLKKHIRTNGDLYYYHLNLLGGSGKVTADNIINAEKGELNLKKWAQDVVDSNGYVIMLKQRFLSPVSDMIIEKNFRERLSDDNKASHPTKEIKPFIEIMRIKPDKNLNLYDVGACLYTRNGDRVLLTKYLNPNYFEDKQMMEGYKSKEGFDKAAKALKEALAKIFTLEIKVNSAARFNNHEEEKFFYTFCILDKKREAIPIKKYFISNEKRFIIYSGPKQFEGITFFATDETLSSEVERMTSLYGIKEWVKRLPEEKFESLINPHRFRSSRYAIGL
ncbi:Uncharacterised protein [Porphyromonas cangingivalis]|uniref:hypothetical protein n=1 Tax=Porphyromonas cangingivalis TaxID=36874 RepID=UPI000D920998|nr:hypothetical protein [Porphyromonas cangingivalis]SPY35014.1 Uncharacterised protein [Porphyromonas cangingivalis]